MAENSFDITKQNNIGLFGPVITSFWKKNYCFKYFFLQVLKCLKFNCFVLLSQKIKCLVLSRYPSSDPQKVLANTQRAVVSSSLNFSRLNSPYPPKDV